MSQQRTQPPRQYGADEVQEILQRTSSLERKKQLERPTLAIEEIEAIAKEAGLDPSLVRRAAQELELKQSEKTLSAKLAGAPLRQVFEREVEGEISAAMHEQLALEIKAVMGPSMTLGTLSSVGRSLNWTSISKQGSAELSLFPRDGKTVIRIEVNTSQFAGGIFGGLMGGIGGGLGINLLWILPFVGHLPWYTGVGAFGATLAGAWGLARMIYGLTAGRLTKRVDTVMDALERRVREQLAPK
jgi:hypothetical protein